MRRDGPHGAPGRVARSELRKIINRPQREESDLGEVTQSLRAEAAPAVSNRTAVSQDAPIVRYVNSPLKQAIVTSAACPRTAASRSRSTSGRVSKLTVAAGDGSKPQARRREVSVPVGVGLEDAGAAFRVGSVHRLDGLEAGEDEADGMTIPWAATWRCSPRPGCSARCAGA
ncbi:hypothetical protein [Dactylosporangium sp. NPDC051484]|uniref:hypothetical protein n=1 Tax=Dactylosporangium sp. NPDC051484 TaxID=3154942 RepID=UPI00345047CE